MGSEMVNAPLGQIKSACLLWQLDSDEIWTAGQIMAVHQMFINNPDRTAALLVTAALHMTPEFVGQPLYANCIHGGNVGTTEPAWSDIPGDQIVDGTVTWANA
jgi:hypothetical protein